MIRELATCRFIESGENVLLLGSPGVGKTHLAVALGLKACEQGCRTLFTTAAGLIATLGKVFGENRLDETPKRLAYGGKDARPNDSDVLETTDSELNGKTVTLRLH